MTYNDNTFQRLFITGRYTLVFLLAVAVLLWIVGWFWGDKVAASTNLQIPYMLPEWVEHVISFALYMGVALILNSFIIIEGRTPWLGGFMMWLTGLFIYLQNDILLPLSLFMLIVALSILFSCHQKSGVERHIFVAFMALGVCTLIFYQFAYLLPLFLLYPMITSVMSARGFVAAFLGLLTPYWLYIGTMLIFSRCDMALGSINAAWNSICTPELIELSIKNISLFVLEFVIIIISALLFIGGSNPAKPLMRKTLKFLMIMNMYLCIIAIFKSQDNNMLMAWRLPALAVMSAYIFSYRITKLFNVYFVILNICWLVVAFLGLWNGL